MAKYKKILVAVDGSDSSLYALRETLRFAKREEARVSAISVVPPYDGDLGSMWVNNVKDILVVPYEEALSRAREIFEEESVPVNLIDEEGEVYERIVDVADAGDYDLIVMGREGRSRLGGALIGSTTARVIGYSQTDVLVVPEGAAIDWGAILLPADGSKYSELAAGKAIDLARAYCR
ncbi:MAG: universal stress protein [Nitrospirota bacterium]